MRQIVWLAKMVALEGYTFTERKYSVPCSLVILIINTRAYIFYKIDRRYITHSFSLRLIKTGQREFNPFTESIWFYNCLAETF